MSNSDIDHPMIPPLELLKLWEGLHFDEGEIYVVMLIQAYQAGADAELEACCEWVSQWRCMVGGNRPEAGLRAARRPKPLSLKDKALKALRAIESGTDRLGDSDIIRQALEQLDD